MRGDSTHTVRCRCEHTCAYTQAWAHTRTHKHEHRYMDTQAHTRARVTLSNPPRIKALEGQPWTQPELAGMSLPLSPHGPAADLGGVLPVCPQASVLPAVQLRCSLGQGKHSSWARPQGFLEPPVGRRSIQAMGHVPASLGISAGFRRQTHSPPAT